MSLERVAPTMLGMVGFTVTLVTACTVWLFLMSPVTVAMFNFISVEQTQWARLAAGAMLAMAPVILIGLFAQRHIVKGLTVGAVKGGGRR